MSDAEAPDLVAGREMAEEVCRLLVRGTPEDLDSCTGLLSAAVEKLRSFSGSPDAAEARRLHLAVRKTARLLQSAADYHAGWISWLEARTGGYQASGEPAGIPRRRLVYVRG